MRSGSVHGVLLLLSSSLARPLRVPCKKRKPKSQPGKSQAAKKTQKVTPRPDPTCCPFIITLKEKCSSSCVDWCVAGALFRQTRSHVYKPGTKSLPKEQSI